jgi:hypothetical protein
MNLLKKIFIPIGDKREINALRSWTVKWTSYRGSSTIAYLNDEAEVFINEQDAITFMNSLNDAFKLTKCKNYDISITENKYK